MHKLFICFAFLLYLNESSAQAIFDFTGLAPGAQDAQLHLPTGYAFQYLAEHGQAMDDGSFMPTLNDFTAYIPINGSSTSAYLCINSESIPGGVSIFNIDFNSTSMLWESSNSGAVDFSSVNGTARNCSGAVTPWNTLITCEEIVYPDFDGDGFSDYGWAIEIDPATKSVIDHPGGLSGGDKLWAMGNFQHENAVVHSNRRTVYQGVDTNTGYLFKFVADVAEDLSSGNLYVYKGSKNGSGEWILLQNDTPADQNSTLNQCNTVGATVFAGVEDVEINPLNGLVYLAVKNENCVYRFTDSDPISGTTVSNFEIFVGGVGATYQVPHAGGTSTADWGRGNDNLAFDDAANLWVQQDGEDNHIWLVSSCHTQSNPCVKIFARTPSGSESTGMTFSPDYKYMFFSIMHPFNNNTSIAQTDAQGVDRYFHKSVSIVVARDYFLGKGSTCPSTLDLGTAGLSSGHFKSDGVLLSANAGGEDQDLTFSAKDTVCLEGGFEVLLGTEFLVEIDSCQ